MEKLCPRCSSSFSCGSENVPACQCSSASLDSLQRSYLQMNYHECLCLNCLTEVKNYFYACEVNPRFKRIKDDLVS